MARTLRGQGNSSHRADTETFVPDWPAKVAPTLDSHFGDKQGLEDRHIRGGQDYSYLAHCLTNRMVKGGDPTTDNYVVMGGSFDEPTHSLSADGFDASEDGTGRGTPIAAFGWNKSASQTMAVAETTDALQASESSNPAVAHRGVRRLTPRECERLQAFPDDWTLVEHRGKPAADGPRYKALGNAVTVNVVFWIAQRIKSQLEHEETLKQGSETR